ncbi:hypothetical protein V9T40_009564 [Parthenolecanium corni]|uniref:Microtubule-associated protein n=1 Tax=Parthenolecanium corni TaxID=536013 RepID=A0AAN9U174_9HEMI
MDAIRLWIIGNSLCTNYLDWKTYVHDAIVAKNATTTNDSKTINQWKETKSTPPNGDIQRQCRGLPQPQPPSDLPTRNKSVTRTPMRKISPKSPEAGSSISLAEKEKKKLPMNKIQVGAAPSPNLKEARSKIGSLQNYTHKPGGGRVKIENRKLEWNAQPRIEAKNENWVPPAAGKKITQVKLQWNAKSKIGSLENTSHRPGGGDKKIETVKLDFKDKAKPKVGSKDNMKHVPGGGAVKIEEQKLMELNVRSKVGSLDNVKHKPGGGDKKIFDDKDYLKQIAQSDDNSKANSVTTSGSQLAGLSAICHDAKSEDGKLLKFVFGLPLLLPDEVDDCFVEDIMACKPVGRNFDVFFNYLLKTYIASDATFPPIIVRHIRRSAKVFARMCSPSSIYEKSLSCGHGYGPGPSQPPFFHSLMGGRSNHLDICYALRCDCYVIIRSLKTMQFYHYVGGDLFILLLLVLVLADDEDGHRCAAASVASRQGVSRRDGDIRRKSWRALARLTVPKKLVDGRTTRHSTFPTSPLIDRKLANKKRHRSSCRRFFVQ